ncbi:MAG: DUF1207 domain-containing protein [Ignavibacteriaceae bacterium]|nr:DUF1207 domain-containing protein [Ignavibacteriaceae bacterium]
MIKDVKLSLIFITIFLFFSNLLAQTKFVFLPDHTNFKPLRGNHQEARMGINFFPSDSHMKVDIGNSTDVLGLAITDLYISVGAEFMAYAYVTSYKGYRLQIDAVDGFFGGNATMRYTPKSITHVFRFRFIHNSAHLVDGHYDITIRDWINGDEPIPYTRDFGELTYAPEFNTGTFTLRPYLLVSQSFRRRPEELKRFMAATGIEFRDKAPLTEFLGKEVNIFGALHFFTAGLPEFTGTISTQFGVKFGDWDSKGISFFLSYYQGNNMFSEYYQMRISRFGVGFNFDFP